MSSTMKERIEEVRGRHASLEAALADPGVSRDPARLRDLAKEHARLAPVVPLPVEGRLVDALVDAVGAIDGDAVVALSGGFDSAFVLSLWRAGGRPLPPTLSLRTPWAAYDERDLVGVELPLA